MKVLVSWLAEFVDVPSDAGELARLLTSIGLKVEGVVSLGGQIEGVLTGKVSEIRPHPNADRLCLVDIEAGDITDRVVCGATNFKEGDIVPYAPVGAQLPSGLMKKAKIRGEVSAGMLCSARDLGLSEEHEGLLVLPSDTPIGADIKEVLGLGGTVLDLEINPNRPDEMSLIGVAREVAAIMRSEIRLPTFDTASASTSIDQMTSVTVEDPQGCPRYIARIVDGVRVGPSPRWAQNRLTAAGMRPVSNVVDATNYALMVYGHPLHAFDHSKLTEGRIVVRRANAGEKMVTLDGLERELHQDDLVIADAVRPVALAGVMGGLDSEVSDQTRRILLESAHFDPRTIFRTSQRYGLRSEASQRFERGMDPENTEAAADYACSLIAEWAGGEVLAGSVDVRVPPTERPKVNLRPARANLVLGLELETDEMVDALARLGLAPTTTDAYISVDPPSRRQDIAIEEDLIEEVGRIVGYDRIPSTLPSGRNRAGGLTAYQAQIRHLKQISVGAGFFEAMTPSFFGPNDIARMGFEAVDPRSKAIRLANPLSVEESILRTTLLPGMIASVARNFSRRTSDVWLFEIGPCFLGPLDPLPNEPIRLGLAIGGGETANWGTQGRQFDLYDLTGAIATIAEALHIQAPEMRPTALVPFHPTRSAELFVGGDKAGVLGQLSDEVMERWDLEYPIFLAEISLDIFLGAAAPPQPWSDPRKYPAVLLDISVKVDEQVLWSDVHAAVIEAGGEILEEVRLFDVYRGPQVGQGRKSLAVSLSMRSPDRTLTEAEALGVRDAILDLLSANVGAEVRA